METNRERQQVAAMLRESVCSDEYLDTAIANALLDTTGEELRPIADVLADLIDPICHVVGTICDDSYDKSGVYYHELSCGHTCKTDYHEPPAFCDQCGSRIVKEPDGN